MMDKLREDDFSINLESENLRESGEDEVSD